MQYDQPAAVGYQQPMYGQPGAAVVTSYGPTQPPMQTTTTQVTYQQPVMVQPVQPQTTVVVVGAGCPHCNRGVMQENFTCPGICLGILCFPIGLVCCFLMRERRCTACGYTTSA
eukprot:TRINITY_DN13994_c0_g1_i1.p1 TRINITY_DN13994_c0_g1~~TRINITY_DN13994_c0_g1_i1.p1  ORF type:complete len:114 (+),score=19.74 TRINITY_DN13994_c0_g1_i1:105-446(+)